jgi:hypothetical protein
VQQQALRDFAQAMRNFFNGTHRRPTWRKTGVHEGFRQVGVKPHHIRLLSRRYGWVVDTEGRLGAVPLDPRRTGGCEVVSGDFGSLWALAYRVCAIRTLLRDRPMAASLGLIAV